MSPVLSPIALVGGGGMLAVALGFIIYAMVRRLGGKYLLFGMLMWIMTVVIKFAIAIPFNGTVYQALSPLGTPGSLFFDLYVGSLTGLTEVLIVWLIVRYTRLGQVSWQRALAFGIGFGTIEALLLGLTSLVTMLVGLLAPQTLPPDMLAQLAPANNLFVSLAPVVERFFTIWIHIFCNVLLFSGVLKFQSRWFWLAFVFKSLLDAWATFDQLSGLLATPTGIWIAEAGVVLLGIVAWYGTLWVRRNYPQMQASPEAVLAPASPSL